jgi:hypothetical protein
VNALQQRFGPFPVWVWLALVTALGGVYYLWERHKAGAAATPATAATQTAAPGVTVIDQAAPTVPQGPAGPAGAPGPAGPPGAPGQSTTPITEPPPVTTPPPPSTKPPATLPGHNLNYAGNVTQIAKRNNLSLAQLIADNPNLKSDVGTGKVLPVGTHIYT